ncbi:MAG: hypothetical protein N3G20_06820, partial [Verrucomicrobiae bacterium]|nr:hypothetical protein [Verrucomicrobiae bacterium]
YINVPSPQSFGSDTGLFYYTIASTSGEDLYVVTAPAIGRAISLLNARDSLTITFVKGEVTAVGGRFLLTDYEGRPIPGQVTVYLNGGTSTVVSGSDTDPAKYFRGFFSDKPIAWLTVSAVGNDEIDKWPSIARLYVGTAVPESATFLLLVLGVLVLIGRGWGSRKDFRRRRQPTQEPGLSLPP